MKEKLSNAVNAVSAALSKLQTALNSAAPGQRGVEEALKLLQEAMQRLSLAVDESEIDQATDGSVQVEELKRATTKLGEATKNIITASRTDPEKIGGCSKDASTAMSSLIDATRILIATAGQVSVYTDLAQSMSDFSHQLVENCHSKDPAAKPNIVKFAKEVSAASQNLGNQISQDASQMENSEFKDALVQCSSNVVNYTTQLVNTAKLAATGQPGSAEKLVN